MTMIRFDVHHYIHNVAADPRVDEILSRLTALKAQGDRLMSVSTEIKEVISSMNDATNEIASDLERLRGQVVGGMSEADAADVKAQLSALKDRLTVLGQDPENPVPPTP